MILFSGALAVLALAVWVFCIIDVVTTPADRVRNLPKVAWIFVVILFIDVGSIAWLVAGRPWNGGAPVGVGSGRRPARRPMSPDDDEEFLASLQKRTDEERRRNQGGDDTAA